MLFLTDRHLTSIVEVLQDCPISPQDVANAKAIFRPSVGALKGKMMRYRSIPVSIVNVRIHGSISERIKELNVHGDICYLNGVWFLVLILDKVKFCTSEAIGNRTDDVLVGTFKKIKETYHIGGLPVRVVSIDGKLSSAKDRIRDEAHMDVNVVSAAKNEPVIERHMRHSKEGVRGMFQMVPFDKKRKLPDRIIIKLVHKKTFFKNAVPELDGISDVLAHEK